MEAAMKPILFGVLGLFAATIVLAADGEDSDEKRRLPDLVLRADRSDITLGETVRLTSVIPADFPIEAKFSHRVSVSIAADYDPKHDRMVCFSPPGDTVRPFPDDKFLGLKGLSAPNKPPPFDVRDPRTKGFERSITPRYLGSYMLTVSWLTSDHDALPSGKLQSQPIIITVRPPKDDQGRSIVKPEWLSGSAWPWSKYKKEIDAFWEGVKGEHTIDCSESLALHDAKRLAEAPHAVLCAAVKSLTPEVARVLTTRPNKELPVYLSGITVLEGPDAVAVAEALASTPAPVVINYLERVSAPALAALRKKATITIPPDEKLTIVP